MAADRANETGPGRHLPGPVSPVLGAPRTKRKRGRVDRRGLLRIVSKYGDYPTKCQRVLPGFAGQKRAAFVTELKLSFKYSAYVCAICRKCIERGIKFNLFCRSCIKRTVRHCETCENFVEFPLGPSWGEFCTAREAAIVLLCYQRKQLPRRLIESVAAWGKAVRNAS